MAGKLPLLLGENREEKEQVRLAAIEAEKAAKEVAKKAAAKRK